MANLDTPEGRKLCVMKALRWASLEFSIPVPDISNEMWRLNNKCICVCGEQDEDDVLAPICSVINFPEIPQIYICKSCMTTHICTLELCEFLQSNTDNATSTCSVTNMCYYAPLQYDGYVLSDEIGIARAANSSQTTGVPDRIFAPQFQPVPDQMRGRLLSSNLPFDADQEGCARPASSDVSTLLQTQFQQSGRKNLESSLPTFIRNAAVIGAKRQRLDDDTQATYSTLSLKLLRPMIIRNKSDKGGSVCSAGWKASAVNFVAHALDVILRVRHRVLLDADRIELPQLCCVTRQRLESIAESVVSFYVDIYQGYGSRDLPDLLAFLHSCLTYMRMSPAGFVRFNTTVVPFLSYMPYLLPKDPDISKIPIEYGSTCITVVSNQSNRHVRIIDNILEQQHAQKQPLTVLRFRQPPVLPLKKES